MGNEEKELGPYICGQIKPITEVIESTKSAHKRIDTIQETLKDVSRIANAVEVMANEFKHMHKEMGRLADDVDYVKEKSETKESVKRVYEILEKIQESHDALNIRINQNHETLSHRMNDVEDRPDKELAAQYKKLKWWLFTLIGGQLFLMIFGLVVYYFNNLKP